MKKLIFLIVLFLPVLLYSQNDTVIIQSKVSDVCVFYQGAQLTRTASVNLIKGQQLIILKKLPAELNEQSIQVKNIPNAQILSVKAQPTSIGNKEKQPIKDVQKNIEEKEQKIRVLNAKLQVYEKEEKMLWDNRQLANEKQSLTILQLKEAADFYRSRMNEIAMENIRIQKEIKTEMEGIQDLNKKINELKNEIERKYSEILLMVDCEKAITTKLSFSYFVNAAGWVPYYDFRVEEINEPLAIVYNANVFQSTGEDWTNVKLKLSGNNPMLKTAKPELNRWYLENNRRQTVTRDVFSLNGGEIRGKVTDATTNEPLPFAIVVIEQYGKQFGATTSDFDGNYIIKPLPAGNYNLKCTFIGYKAVLISNVIINKDKITFLDVSMQQSAITLESVEIVEYKTPLISRDQLQSGATITSEDIARMPGVSASSEMGGVYGNYRGARSGNTVQYVDGVRTRNTELQNTNFISNDLQRNISNLEYVIETPYSILSDGKDYAIRIKEAKMPVDYHYLAIPKLDADPFLICEVNNWQNLNLLDAKYNIFFKGTFVGESVLNTNEASDTLKISLGRDKNLYISRNGIKEINDKKVNDNNIKETVGWNITVKNTKPYPIHIIIEDQYPVTERKSIDIRLNDAMNAKVDAQSGKLSWDYILQANEKKEIKFNYTVKYPKYIGVNTD
ncbi:MAG: mucoidy inhibitor MuiA family protein [Bacteroidetes bacterium]|nr:mucoidy inhibitor MuiA family protein [Bacteroidota bacterium]